jgi:hypothetical protein
MCLPSAQRDLSPCSLDSYLLAPPLDANPSEFSLVRRMRQRMVDDVPHRCYSCKVPRVKSGLPVRGWFFFCAHARMEDAEKAAEL